MLHPQIEIIEESQIVWTYIILYIINKLIIITFKDQKINQIHRIILI